MTKQATTQVPRSTLVQIKGLKPHPRNYRDHPDDQVEHLMQSIREHGFYRNVVITQDSTILAGHGIVLAADRLDMEKVAAIRLPIDPDSPQALKILAADNYVSHFAEDDDRLLTELLREVSETDSLLGTGFSDQALAALVMVTRDGVEIADLDEAAEWVGMPAFDHDPITIGLNIHFANEADRLAVIDLLGIADDQRRGGKVWSVHWPPRRRDDSISVIFE